MNMPSSSEEEDELYCRVDRRFSPDVLVTSQSSVTKIKINKVIILLDFLAIEDFL